MKWFRKSASICVFVGLLVLAGEFAGETAFAEVRPSQNSVADAGAAGITSDLNGTAYSVDFPEAPRRAVSLSHFTTETMLALELEERMAGVAWMDNAPLAEFEAALGTIPLLSNRYPSREVLLDAEPDFVTGWASAFSDENFPPSFLEWNGIRFYLPRVEYPGASMDSVYEDFMLLGRIFRVEDRAASIVAKMRARIAAIREKIATRPELTVFMYDSGDTAPYTAGNSLPSDLIRLAGGKNIYGGASRKWFTVQWESVIEQNPDWIIVIQSHGGNRDAVRRMEFLRNNAATRELDAVRNERVFVMELADLTSGPRTPGAVERMARRFHPQAFE